MEGDGRPAFSQGREMVIYVFGSAGVALLTWLKDKVDGVVGGRVTMKVTVSSQ